VNEDGIPVETVDYWMKKSRENLEFVREIKDRYTDIAISRLYYAAFYIVLAYATLKGEKYRKHSGIMNFLFEKVIREGLIDKKFSRLYRELYYSREEADYTTEAIFDPDEVMHLLSRTEEFINEMERLIKSEMKTG